MTEQLQVIDNISGSKVNLKQKNVLVANAIIVAMMLLYPPHTYLIQRWNIG